MSQEVQDVVARLTADGSPVAKELTATEKRFTDYARHVDDISKKVAKSINDGLGPVGTYAAALVGKLDSVTDALMRLEQRAGTTKTELEGLKQAEKEAATEAGTLKKDAKDAAAEIGAMSKEAGGAAAALGKATTASRGMQTAIGTLGSKVNSTMAGVNRSINATAKSINKASSAASQAARSAGSGGGGGGHQVMGGFMALGAGLAILDGLKESVTAGAQLDDLIHKIYAEAGETAPFDKMRDGILSIAKATDQMPTTVAAALYPIESAGYHGAAGLKILSAAATMAKGTEADLLDVTSLVTKTMKAYQLPVDKAGHVTDVYTRAITASLVPAKEFVPAMAGVMQVGEHAGLSVQELSAALALLTQTSKSAGTSGTYLKNFLSSLIAPAAATRKEAKKLGLEWLASGDALGHIKKYGFEKTLMDIEKATNGNARAQAALYPDMRKIQSLFGLLGDGGSNYSKALKNVTDSAGATQRAANEMDKSLLQMGKHLAAQFQVIQEKITIALGPTILKLGGIINQTIGWFDKLTPHQQKMIILVVAAAGVILTLIGVLSLAGVALSALSGGFTMLSGGLMGLLGGFKNLIMFLGRLPQLITTVVAGMRALATAQGIGGVITAIKAMMVAGRAAALQFIADFGPGALVFAALAGLAYEIYRIVDSYHTMEDAINQAAAAQQRFNDKVSTMIAQGGASAIMGQRAKNQSESTDLNDAITQAQNDPINLTTFQKDMEVRQILGDKGYDTKNHSYNSVEGAQNRVAALDADAAKLGASLAALNKQNRGTGASDANRMVDTHADQLAPYQSKLLQAVGQFHDASVQCGEFIRQGAAAFGFVGSIQAAANAALKGKNVVASDGKDSHGNMRFPNGTVIYFGSKGHQHFVSTYVNDRGEQKVVENTEAGTGKGKWRVRADRDLETIMKEYRGRYVAFHLQGVAGPHSSGPDNSPIMPPATNNAPPAGFDAADPKKKKSPFYFQGRGAQAQSMEQMVPGFTADTTSLKALMNAVTGVNNVKSKMAVIDDLVGRQQDALDVRLARGNGVLYENGKALSDHAVQVKRNGIEIAALIQKNSIHLNAIKNGTDAEKKDNGSALADHARYLKAFADWQKMGQMLNGKVIKPADTQALEHLQKVYERLGASAKAYAQQARANRAMVVDESHAYAQDATRVNELVLANKRLAEEDLTAQDKTKKDQYNAGSLTRGDYSKYLTGQLADPNLDADGDRAAKLKEALEKLGEMSALQKQIERDSMRLTAKSDFDQRRIDLSEQIDQLTDQAKGDQAALDAIKKYSKIAGDKIDSDEDKDKKKNVDAYEKQQADNHLLPLDQYKAYLVERYNETVAADGVMSEEAAKFADEIYKIDEQGLKKRLDDAKEQYETGKMNLRQYLADLKGIEADARSVGSVEVTDDIGKVYDEMGKKAEEKAQKSADKFTDFTMQIVSHSKTLKQSLDSLWKDAVTNFEKNSVHTVALKIIEQVQGGKAGGFLQKVAGGGKKSDSQVMKEASLQHTAAALAMQKSAAGHMSAALVMQNAAVGMAAAANRMAGAASGVGLSNGSRKPSDGVPLSVGLPSSGKGMAAASGGLNPDIATAGQALGIASAAAGLSKNGQAAGRDIGYAGQALGVASDLSSNQDSKAGMDAVSGLASDGALGTSVAAAMPWVGVALAAASMLGIMGGTQKPDYTDKTGAGQYGSILGTDHATSFDSGYSGTSGMRSLQMAYNARSSAASAGSTTKQFQVGNINISEAANASDVAAQVMDQMDRNAGLQDAQYGRS